MRRDLNWRSSELICWLTADCVILLIWAALVKLSLSARSQKILRLSICIRQVNLPSTPDASQHRGSLRGQGLFDLEKQILAGERLLQIAGVVLFLVGPDVTAGTEDAD